ncbi:MAG: HAMP domain-containing protein, partial [Gammaproteobacteria bacterium]|nr:HAMP domain-containing protein [Gammaproteobacteria bacterium]
MRNRWLQSLSFRAMIGTVLLLLLLFGLITLNTQRILWQFGFENARSLLAQTSETLNLAIVPRTTREEFDELNDYLNVLISGDGTGIVYLALHDDSGQILVSTHSMPTSLPDASVPLETQLQGPIVHISQPILLYGNKVGTLHYGYSTRLLHATNKQLFTANLALLLLGMLIVLAVLAFIGLRLSRRFNNLSSASRALANGNYAIRAPEWGNDELTELARSFNRMADRVSERTKALRDSRNALEQAQAVARIGSWHHDLTANTYTASREALRIIGIPEAENPIPMNTLFGNIYPDDLEKVRAAQASALSGQPYGLTFRVWNGEDYAIVHTEVVCEFAANGEVIGTSGTLRDVTERTRIESELETYRQHLEELVEA